MTFKAAKILICPDGTLVFDRKAMVALQLEGAHSIAISYSSYYEQFALRPIKANGSDLGVALDQAGGRIFAYCAADFLQGAGILPGKPTKYEAQYNEEIHAILVKNVAIKKRRKTA